MFSLRNVPSYDQRSLALIEAFLLGDSSGGIRLRPREEIERAMESGLCLEISRDGAICGCSLIYKFDTWPGGPVYAEMGSMLVTARPYSLQWFLAAFHLFQIYLEEFDSNPSEIFAVVAARSASEHNLRDKAGLVGMAPPAALQVIRAGRGLAFAPDKPVLFAKAESFDRAFADLRSWHEKGRVFRTPKGGERIEIEVEWFLPELLDLLGGGK
ncbi:MAG TPA: hypothetical protein VF547_07935 [Allosphingosinicella sp.]|jgi:hypothetical protein